MSRRGRGQSAADGPARPFSRRRTQFLARWRLSTSPDEAAGATLDDWFPGINWGDDLDWGMRRWR